MTLVSDCLQADDRANIKTFYACIMGAANGSYHLIKWDPAVTTVEAAFSAETSALELVVCSSSQKLKGTWRKMLSEAFGDVNIQITTFGKDGGAGLRSALQRIRDLPSDRSDFIGLPAVGASPPMGQRAPSAPAGSFSMDKSGKFDADTQAAMTASIRDLEGRVGAAAVSLGEISEGLGGVDEKMEDVSTKVTDMCVVQTETATKVNDMSLVQTETATKVNDMSLVQTEIKEDVSSTATKVNDMSLVQTEIKEEVGELKEVFTQDMVRKESQHAEEVKELQTKRDQTENKLGQRTKSVNEEKRAHERTREQLNRSRTKVGRLEVENNDLRMDKETLNGTVTSLTASNASLIASNHMLSLAVLRLRARICTHAPTSD